MGGKIPRGIKKDLAKLAKRIERAGKVIFFLDYDGTLTPIRRKPGLARIKKTGKALLRKLVREPWAKVFILSGRSLKDLRVLLGIKGLYYIGNHGIELEGPGLKSVNRAAKALKPVMQKIYRALLYNLKFRGVKIDNKRYTLSVHYRLADPDKVPLIKKAYIGTIKDLLRAKRIRVTEGKKVFEVRPNVDCDKGTVVRWILNKISSKDTLPVCIGDDKTDEDAFRALRKKGISILVSKKKRKTYAGYRVGSTRSAIDLLEWILRVKRKKVCP